MEDPDEQGEAWFNQENSVAERHSMLRLERELEATLTFEHSDGEDSGPKSNESGSRTSCWVVYLGRDRRLDG